MDDLKLSMEKGPVITYDDIGVHEWTSRLTAGLPQSAINAISMQFSGYLMALNAPEDLVERAQKEFADAQRRVEISNAAEKCGLTQRIDMGYGQEKITISSPFVELCQDLGIDPQTEEKWQSTAEYTPIYSSDFFGGLGDGSCTVERCNEFLDTVQKGIASLKKTPKDRIRERQRKFGDWVNGADNDMIPTLIRLLSIESFDMAAEKLMTNADDVPQSTIADKVDTLPTSDDRSDYSAKEAHFRASDGQVLVVIEKNMGLQDKMDAWIAPMKDNRVAKEDLDNFKASFMSWATEHIVPRLYSMNVDNFERYYNGYVRGIDKHTNKTMVRKAPNTNITKAKDLLVVSVRDHHDPVEACLHYVNGMMRLVLTAPSHTCYTIGEYGTILHHEEKPKTPEENGGMIYLMDMLRSTLKYQWFSINAETPIQDKNQLSKSADNLGKAIFSLCRKAYEERKQYFIDGHHDSITMYPKWEDMDPSLPFSDLRIEILRYEGQDTLNAAQCQILKRKFWGVDPINKR